ncbi:MAG: hypothetical protein AAGJ93_00450 [Bacteroidota bacterium]
MQKNSIISALPTHIIVPLVLLLGVWVMAKSVTYQGANSSISLMLTLDLLVTIPVAYFLLIRKKAVPKFTVVSVFVLCLLLAGIILPPDQQTWLTTAKQFAIPLAELFVAVFVTHQFIKTRRAFKSQKKNLLQQDFYDTLKIACKKALPKPLASIVSMEVGVIYYSFFAWSKPLPKEHEFTYHKKSGIALILGTFMGMIVVETFAAHLLLERWNTTVAWVATLLSAYTLLQFFALIRSLARRPIQIEGEQIIFRYGFFSEITVPLSAIEEIKTTSRTWPEGLGIRQLSPLGALASHNIILHFNQELTLSGLYGRTHNCKGLALFVDDKEDFVEKVETVSKGGVIPNKQER